MKNVTLEITKKQIMDSIEYYDEQYTFGPAVISQENCLKIRLRLEDCLKKIVSLERMLKEYEKYIVEEGIIR